MAYPEADIYQVSENGIKLIAYQDTEQYKLMRYFMNNHGTDFIRIGIRFLNQKNGKHK